MHQQAGTLNSTADVLESIEKDSQAVTHVLDCTTLPDSGLTKNHNPHQVFSPHFTSVLGLMCQHKQGGSLQLVWPQSVSWKCQTRLSHTESNFEREARNLCRTPDDWWPALHWVQTSFPDCHLVSSDSTARSRMLHQDFSLQLSIFILPNIHFLSQHREQCN